MIMKSRFCPGQHVKIQDAEQVARVSGVLVAKHGLTYICRWWDGTNFQENEFDEFELTAYGEGEGVVMLCEGTDVEQCAKSVNAPL